MKTFELVMYLKVRDNFFLQSLLLLFLISGVTVRVAGEIPQIKDLDYSNTDLQKLREEIKINLHVSKTNSATETMIPLRFMKYKIVQGDTYSKIQTKSMLDISTIQSINTLTSPQDIRKDKMIYLSNMRGIYDNEELPNSDVSREKLAKKYNIKAELIIYDNEFRGEWFIPGQRMTSKELTFFSGQAFTQPLDDIPEKSLSLVRPVQGATSSKWGRRIDPFTKKETFHGGMDIAANKGSDVYSSAPGTVILAGSKGGYGNLVVLKHDYGYETRYGHLDEIFVEIGQKVKKREIIGKVGNTGRATGYHLHFEVIRNQKNQKPIFNGHQ